MNGRDFLPLARTLSNLGTEPAWRSAVSRAYYAAFHVARDWVSALGFVVPAAERAHGYLWLRLSNCGAPTVQGAGANLNILRRERNRADYDVGSPLTAAVMARSLQRAQDIIQALDAANVEPMRSQIRDVMKVYERDVLNEVTWRP
jgi:hypothetical protein